MCYSSINQFRYPQDLLFQILIYHYSYYHFFQIFSFMFIVAWVPIVKCCSSPKYSLEEKKSLHFSNPVLWAVLLTSMPIVEYAQDEHILYRNESCYVYNLGWYDVSETCLWAKLLDPDSSLCSRTSRGMLIFKNHKKKGIYRNSKK